MKIGIIGAGNIGGTLARLLVDSGHEVGIANSRGPETLQEFVSQLGKNAQAMTVAEAAAFGDVVIVSIPFGSFRSLPAKELTGKVVIDTNNYYPERDGHFIELDDDRSTSSELLQKYLLGARVVKAFNNFYAEWLATHGRPAEEHARVAMPLSGDDRAAKQIVARLIEAIGFDPVDVGNLAEGGRRHQKGGPLYGVEFSAEELNSRLGSEEQPAAT